MYFDHEPAAQHPVLTPEEIEELMLLLQAEEDEPVTSPNSGSDEGSNQGSGSTGSGSTDEERKRKRMISNKESARRSRGRKKRYLEDLTTEADRLSKEKRELKDRLGFVANRFHLVRNENEQLRSESVALLDRLSNLHRIFMALHAMSN